MVTFAVLCFAVWDSLCRAMHRKQDFKASNHCGELHCTAQTLRPRKPVIPARDCLRCHWSSVPITKTKQTNFEIHSRFRQICRVTI